MKNIQILLDSTIFLSETLILGEAAGVAFSVINLYVTDTKANQSHEGEQGLYSGLKTVFFAPGHEFAHDPLLIQRCSSPVELSESNPLPCQMRPITFPTNQSFPATEPTSNSLI